MTPERWQEVKKVLAGALERTPAERHAYLDQACTDVSLRQEVESLIAAHEQGDSSFMERPAVESNALKSGVHLGPYEILAPLGAGGMGEVYEARDTKLGRSVAVKVLPLAFVHDTERLARFQSEAQMLASLNHPNIATIHGLEQADGVHYIVMELVPGETLAERIRKGPLPLEQALKITSQIAEALETAHEKGVIHRDLKPANVKVTPEGRVKVLDFGLAKAFASGIVQSHVPTLTAIGTEEGRILGTSAYMSPEQARGKPIDKRTDIWAFGCVFYELLTGKQAFRGETTHDTIAAVLEHDPDWQALPPQTPATICDLLRRCLQKDRQLRLRDLGDARIEIEETLIPRAAAEPTKQQDGDLAASRRRVPLARRWRGSSRRDSIAARRDARWISVVVLTFLLAALFGLNVGGWRERLLTPKRPSHISSLAVLPLENFSRDPDQEYFAEGMTEALIADLSKITALRVISRTSVVPYKDTRKSLPEIARELRVDAVVEGSVERASDHVKIIVQLVDAQNDRNLWGDSYDGDLRDVLSVQDRVAQAIAGEIRVQLRPQESAGLAKGRPVDPMAYEAYLRGRYLWNKRTPGDLKKAIDEFKKAIDLDPTYALAWAGLADGYSMLSDYDEQPPRETIPLARAAAKKALEIDDSLGEPRVTLADIEWTYDWNLSAAERDFERAITLSVNYASAHQWYGMYLCSRERFDDGIAELERAQTLDPLSLVIEANLGRCRYYARHYDQAVELLERLEQREPDYWIVHAILGQTYLAMGRLDGAIRELERARILSPQSPFNVGVLGDAYGRAGRRAEALKLAGELAGLSRTRYVPPVYRAMIYVGLEERSQAMAFLERAYADRSSWMVLLDNEPQFDSLRSDPRFRDLLHRIAQPPEQAVQPLRTEPRAPALARVPAALVCLTGQASRI